MCARAIPCVFACISLCVCVCVCVQWGDKHITQSALECCAACRAHSGCNTWVWCAADSCGGSGANVRVHGECWLKQSTIDDIMDLKQRANAGEYANTHTHRNTHTHTLTHMRAGTYTHGCMLLLALWCLRLARVGWGVGGDRGRLCVCMCIHRHSLDIRCAVQCVGLLRVAAAPEGQRARRG